MDLAEFFPAFQKDDPDLHLQPLPSLKGSVHVFGEILVDVFPDRKVLGGAPFNVAHHLHAFGLHPTLISRIGNDATGRELSLKMRKTGMDVKGLQTDRSRPTGQVVITMVNESHSFEILPNQAYDFIDADLACKTVAASPPDLIYFGTLAQRNPVSRKALDLVSKGALVPHFLDINLREPWYDTDILRSSLTRADILKLNAEELRLIAGLLNMREDSDEHLAENLMHAFDIQCILVTCGDKGAWLITGAGNTVTTGNRSATRIIDTVGAGDGFSAIFLLGLFCRWPLEEVLTRADAFARSICQIRGAVPDDHSFYRSFSSAWDLTDGASP